MATEELEKTAAAAGETSTEGEGGQEEKKETWGVSLDDWKTFRQARKKIRHFVAHEEYGVVFSMCGIRTTKNIIEYNPKPIEGEVNCNKCRLLMPMDGKKPKGPE